eukprot:Gb_23341 [translate_table: standard]
MGREEELSRFHGLPPLKRFKLLQKENKMHQEDTSSFCLPAKKRIWAVRDFMLEQKEGMEDEGIPLMKVTKYEDMKNVAYKWCKATKKRSEKAPSKCSETVREEFKLKKFEDKPKNSEENPKREEEKEEEEDGVICNVCRGQDGNSSDPIVFCDGCDLMVHASCYGDPLIKEIPQGDWFCARCMEHADAPPQQQCCFLCPSSKGAMKRTTRNSWAHISCALLVPEVFFQCPEGREGIDCSRVPSRRWRMVCSFCDMARGACIECSEPRCPCTFHISCGLDRDFSIEYMESKAGGIVIGFCDVHTPKWQKQQETGRFKIVPREPTPTESAKKRKHPYAGDRV